MPDFGRHLSSTFPCRMLLLLMGFVLVGAGRYNVIEALNADPNIDLIEIEEFQTLPNICNGKECPK